MGIEGKSKVLCFFIFIFILRSVCFCFDFGRKVVCD